MSSATVLGERPSKVSVPVGSMAMRLAPALIGAAVGGRAASSGDQGAIGAWGLVEVLPWPYYGAVAMVAVSFVAALSWPSPVAPSRLVAAVHLIVLVVLLHGAPAFLEELPRFATAWLHAGFTEQILAEGTTVPNVDARFSWPGFFAAAAAICDVAGVDDPRVLLRWAPVVMATTYLLPLWVIGRHLVRSEAAVWVGMALFVLVNWVGQDYFAPQSVGFLQYLLMMAILVVFFRQGRQLRQPRIWQRITRASSWDGHKDLVVPPTVRVALLGLLVVLVASIAVTHQLTPGMVVFGTGALVLVGRCRLILLPVVAGILFLGWISVGATTYWVGHLDDIFGGVGDLAGTFGATQERVTGSPEHAALTNARLLFSVGVWGAAALAALVLRRRGPFPLTLSALTVAPFAAAAAQSYGGEAMIRVFLFSAPFACLLLGAAVVGERLGRGRALGVGMLLVALVPGFVLLRYGNESFEQVRAADVEAIEALYRLAPPGSTIISPASQVPWRYRMAATHDYGWPADPEAFRRGDLAAIRDLTGQAEDANTFLVVTRSQEVYATQVYGDPDGWFLDRVAPHLTPARGYRLVYASPLAWVYAYRAVS